MSFGTCATVSNLYDGFSNGSSDAFVPQTGPHHPEYKVATLPGFPVAFVKSPLSYAPDVFPSGSLPRRATLYAAASGLILRFSADADGSTPDFKMLVSDAAADEYAQQRLLEP